MFQGVCYHLGKQLNCPRWRTTISVVLSGIVSPTMPVLFITLASVKALVAFPLLNPYAHLGHSSYMIGMLN